ncbi:MAG: GNAT superfamily N-acetyltransferase, partial [Paracoccaceae bacterium]
MVAIKVIEYGPEDAAACCVLSDEAGWNQTATDWDMMLRIGWAPGLRGEKNQPLASALALPMQGGIGWISMVLVTASKRRQGIAQQLVGQCIDWLEARGHVPVLDATADGQPLYASMGFTPICGIKRLSGAGGGSMPEGLRNVNADEIGWIAALEDTTFGAGREPVLRNLLSRPGAVALAHEQNGFALSRAGRNATQIGPLVARDEASALALLQGALARIKGPVLVD